MAMWNLAMGEFLLFRMEVMGITVMEIGTHIEEGKNSFRKKRGKDGRKEICPLRANFLPSVFPSLFLREFFPFSCVLAHFSTFKVISIGRAKSDSDRHRPPYGAISLSLSLLAILKMIKLSN